METYSQKKHVLRSALRSAFGKLLASKPTFDVESVGMFGRREWNMLVALLLEEPALEHAEEEEDDDSEDEDEETHIP